MNLVEQPWIEAISAAGQAQTVSLAGLFTDTDQWLTLATGDPVTEAAIWRLLFAIDSAAHDAGTTPATWLADHHDRFNLFDPTAPFGQHPGLGPVADWRPISVLVVGAAAASPTYHDQHHLAASWELDPARAAAELLVRVGFGPSGRQPFRTAAFGPNAVNGKTAVMGGRTMCWITGPNLAATLAANRVSGGTFHFTWPTGHTIGDPLPVDGPISALTYPSRAVLLRPTSTGTVDAAMVCNGAVFPTTAGPDVLPHAIYTRAKPTDPWASQRMSKQALPWLRLAEALTNPDTPDGILATARAMTTNGTAAGYSLHSAGLATEQARIDGALAATMPLPATDDALEAVAAVCAKARMIGPDARRRVTTALTRTDTTIAAEWIDPHITALIPDVRAHAATLAQQAAAGHLNAEQATARMDTTVAEALEATTTALDDLGHHRAAAHLRASTGQPIGEITPRARRTRHRTDPRQRGRASDQWRRFMRAVKASQHANTALWVDVAYWIPGTITPAIAEATNTVDDTDSWQIPVAMAHIISNHQPTGTDFDYWDQHLHNAEDWADLVTCARYWANAQTHPNWDHLAATLTQWTRTHTTATA